ncbi:MAG TPA: hypothetical protein VEU08_15765, partial [Vicinamibacterales bacterium]|nr:hypothetical protein [Vicinamibacterales bacterium]
MRTVQIVMRLSLLVITAIFAVSPAVAQPPVPSPPAEGSSTAQGYNLPVDLNRISRKLEQPPAPVLRGMNEVPDFSVEIQEKQRIDELVAAVLKDVKRVPVPA